MHLFAVIEIRCDTCNTFDKNCLKCISFSSPSGKLEGYLNPIPNGNIPFETLRVDHYGPVNKHVFLRKYIFLIVDAFSKYIKLYPTKTTNSREAITCLKQFFQSYNKPINIISDRGTAFISQEFEDFLHEQSINHIKIATGSPDKLNIKRINRFVAPSIAKLSENKDGKQWYKVLHEVEYAINNTTNRYD